MRGDCCGDNEGYSGLQGQPDYGFDVLSEAYQNAGQAPQKDTPVSNTPVSDRNLERLHRRTFTVPPGFEALRDGEGRATGEIRATTSGKSKGPSTYLHAGASKGWPYDQKAEDTFEVPSITQADYAAAEQRIFAHMASDPLSNPDAHKSAKDDRQYLAQYTNAGGVELVLRHPRTFTHIANFNNFADAQTAAKALNELKGY